MDEAIRVESLKKYYGKFVAVDDISFDVRSGEIFGILGPNGAGKTTLMKVISGLYKPSSGSLFFEGNKKVLESPRDSQNLGLEMVYQDLALAGNLPIGENIFLGREPTKNLGFLKLLMLLFTPNLIFNHFLPESMFYQPDHLVWL